MTNQMTWTDNAGNIYNANAANPMPTGIADVSATGSLTALNQAVTLTGLNGKAAGLIQLSGTWTGSIQLEGSNDGFVTTTTLSTTQSGGAAPSTTAITANGDYRVLGTVNYASIRARVSAFTSGTIVANLKMSDAIGITPVISTNAAGFLATVTGNVAAGATDSGNALKIGGVFNTSAPVYTNGQRADFQSTTNGELKVVVGNAGTTASVYGSPNGNQDGFSGSSVLLVNSYGSLFNGTNYDRQRGDVNGTVVQPGLSSTFWNYAAAAGGIVNTTTAVTVKAAAGAGVRNYIMALNIDNDLLGAATEIAIRDGAAGTVLWRGKLQTAAGARPPITFNPPLKGTANTLVEAVTLTAVTGGVFVNLQGYTGN